MSVYRCLCLTYGQSPAVVQGTLQGALLRPSKHGGVNGDLHAAFAAQPHPLALTHHLALVLVWTWGKRGHRLLPKGPARWGTSRQEQTGATCGALQRHISHTSSHGDLWGLERLHRPANENTRRRVFFLNIHVGSGTGMQQEERVERRVRAGVFYHSVTDSLLFPRPPPPLPPAPMLLSFQRQ